LKGHGFSRAAKRSQEAALAAEGTPIPSDLQRCFAESLRFKGRSSKL